MKTNYQNQLSTKQIRILTLAYKLNTPDPQATIIFGFKNIKDYRKAKNKAISRLINLTL